MTPRQRNAFVLTATSAPAITVASGLPWPWVLSLSLLCLSLLIGLYSLQERAGTPLPGTQGGIFGKSLLLLQAVFCTVLLWQLALGTDSAFPDEATVPFVPLTLLCVCAYASFRGRRACVRAVAVLFLLLMALYAFIFFFAAQKAELRRLLTLPEERSLLPYGVVLLVPFYGLYLYEPGLGHKKFPMVSGALFLLLPLLASLLCDAVAGSGGSFYTMAKSVEVLSFAQRIEPLVSVLLTVGWFSALCLLSLSADRMLGALGLREGVGGALSCLAAGLGLLWKKPLPPGFLLGSGAVFCVLLPLLTQCFVVRKKGKNFLKKPQKNG